MIKKSTKKIFILGTDTEVGKTFIAGSLARTLHRKGLKVGVFKPFESGGIIKKEKLYGLDSLHLKKAAKSEVDIDLINPHIFKAPLAPAVAATLEKKSISFKKVKKCFEKIYEESDFTIVEGAGGLLVPIYQKKTNLDLIQSLDLEVLLVARSGLGTINHTLLTLEMLKKSNIKVRGVILNQIHPKIPLSEKTNLKTLKNFGAPVWGIFPYSTTTSIDKRSDLFDKSFSQFLKL